MGDPTLEDCVASTPPDDRPDTPPAAAPDAFPPLDLGSLLQIADNIDGALWVFDVAAGRFIYASRGHEQVWAMSGESLLADARSWLETIHPDDRDDVRRRFDQLPQLGGVFDEEFRLLRADGAQRWIRMRCSVTEHTDASARRIVGLSEDITAVRRAEQTSRRYAAIVGSSDDAIIGFALDGTIQTWNAGAERMYGYTSVQAVGHPLSMLMERDRPSELPDMIARLESGEHIAHVEAVRRTRDGRTLDVSLTVSPIKDGLGRLVGASSIARDITAAKEARRSLVESEQLHRTLVNAILDAAVDAIITIDAHGTIESANPATLAMFGYELDELLGQNVKLIMPQPYRQEHDGYLERFIETGEKHIIGRGREVVGLRRDGTTFPVDLAVNEVRYDHRVLFAGILRDITERKRLEDEFLQAQKMEAVGRLAGGIAHDFNNLLMGLLGSCRMAGTQLGPDHPAQVHIHEIVAEAERGAALTRQLLDFSRKRPTRLEPIDINEVVAASQRMLSNLLGEDIKLQVDLCQTPSIVVADRGLIDQVLMNLAVNSRDAMPRGGRLLITTSEADCSATDQALGEVRPGRHVALSVVDSGQGMDEETRRRAFEPFYTTKTTGEGTGLGLATVYGIIKQLGGHIHVDSALGRGTTIRTHLPLSAAPTTRAPEARADATPEGRGETILIVEDERLVRASLRHLLADLGYQVLEAEHGEQALAVSRGADPPIELVLSDIVLPGVPGPELVEQLRVLQPGLRAVFMSAHPNELLVEQGRLPADEPSLEKPFSDGELARALRAALDA